MTFLSPENPLSGVNLVIVLCLVMLSAVIFICFSGFVKYSIVLNILKNAIGTQQIPPSIVLNLLAALLALSSIWPAVQPGLERIKPYFLEHTESTTEFIDPVSGIGLNNVEVLSGDVNLVRLLENIDLYFPELIAQAEDRAEKMNGKFALPSSFVKSPDNILKPLIGALIYDLYNGFELGIKLYMIFVSIDFLVAMILSGVGMSMLSPTVISIPIKLATFYFSDGWATLFDLLS